MLFRSDYTRFNHLLVKWRFFTGPSELYLLLGSKKALKEMSPVHSNFVLKGPIVVFVPKLSGY